MNQIFIKFHGNLAYFLKKDNPEPLYAVTFFEKTAIKHIIEAQGVPHPEVGLIQCNGASVDLRYAVRNGDVIHVFPNHPHQNNHAESDFRFILDNHLGKLMNYLRILGFDTIYAQDWSDDTIAQFSHNENRILLTRDRGLLMRKIVSRGYCVRSDRPLEQLAEVEEVYGLKFHAEPFRRCPRCNGILTPVDKDNVLNQLLPLTRQYYDKFTKCVDCGQVYWKGSHFNRIKSLLTPFTDRFLEG